MTSIVVGIVYGAAGIGVFALAQTGGIKLTAGILAAVAVAALLLSVFGRRVGCRRPLLGSVLVELSPAVVTLVAAGVLSALLILASVAVLNATGEHASGSKKAFSEAVGGLIVLAVSFVGKAGEYLTPSAFGRLFVKERYGDDFGEMPDQAGPKLEAYRDVRDAFQGEGGWGIRSLEKRLRRICAALTLSSAAAPNPQRSDSETTKDSN